MSIAQGPVQGGVGVGGFGTEGESAVAYRV